MRVGYNPTLAQVTEDEIVALMREIDVDGDDRISFDEFQGFLQQKSK